MNNNLGRDRLWNDVIWQEIDKAVLAEIGRIRVAQKVFLSTPRPNAPNVPADIFDPKTFRIAEGETTPFIELSLEFPLTQSQVDNESTLWTGRTLARLAVKSLALAEDLLFFQGEKVELPDHVNAVNKGSIGDGLLGLAKTTIAVDPIAPQKQGIYGENTFSKVAQGIAELTRAAQPGPYALILETSIYADTYRPLLDTLATTADRLVPMVTGGFYGTGTLPVNTGLLVSLGGVPTSLYVAQDAITAFTQEDKNGDYLFRVFERIQMVVRDPASLIKLEFK